MAQKQLFVGSKICKFRPIGISYLQTTLNRVFGQLVVGTRPFTTRKFAKT
jgi:hypothetical protein